MCTGIGTDYSAVLNQFNSFWYAYVATCPLYFVNNLHQYLK